MVRTPGERLTHMHLSGKRNDDEDAKEKLFVYASPIIVTSFKVRLSNCILFVR
jgi:hypothetical protein